MRRGETFETTIESLAFGGRGVGHAPDGRVAFVEGSVPGDEVRAFYTKIKRDLVEARVESVLTASPDRVEPRCPHFGRCGGCRLQMMAYPAQVEAKGRQVEEALQRIGGLADTTVLEAIPADDPWFYRNKMEFTFGRDRDNDDQLILGLHRRGRFDWIVDLTDCFIVDERAGDLLAAVRTWARDHGFAPYDSRRAEGLLRYLVLRLGKLTGEVMVDLVTTSERAPASEAFVSAVHSVIPEATVVHTTHRGRATAYIVEQQEVLSGPGVILERLGRLEFQISPASFFQTNSLMAPRLFEEAAKAAELTGDERVLDLYCGTGAIGIGLSASAREVVGLEMSEAAIADAERNASLERRDEREVPGGQGRGGAGGRSRFERAVRRRGGRPAEGRPAPEGPYRLGRVRHRPDRLRLLQSDDAGSGPGYTGGG